MGYMQVEGVRFSVPGPHWRPVEHVPFCIVTVMIVEFRTGLQFIYCLLLVSTIWCRTICV